MFPLIKSFKNLEILEIENLKRGGEEEELLDEEFKSGQSLRELRVRGADEVRGILKSSVVAVGISIFPNLVEIKISECNKLKSIFSIAVFEHLPKLLWLYVALNAELEQVLEQEEDDKEKEEKIVTHQLLSKQLSFHLPKLTVFKGGRVSRYDNQFYHGFG